MLTGWFFRLNQHQTSFENVSSVREGGTALLLKAQCIKRSLYILVLSTVGPLKMIVTIPNISNSRIAHSYPGSEYLLPCDEEERERLLMQHQLTTRLFSGRLVFPPITLSSNAEILDIGAGAGAWLSDLRAKLEPSIQIYGIDIESRLFPRYSSTSPNIHLSVASATDLPFYWSSKFTLVHQRLLVAAYTKEQWYAAVKEMYRVLRPGGYAQLWEVYFDYTSGPITAAYMSFMQVLFEAKGMLIRCCDYIEDMLTAAGFVDVRVESVVVKLGKWAGRDGIEARDQVIGAWRGLKDAVMKAGGMGFFATGEEFDKQMEDLGEEWDRIEGSHNTMKVFYGRKP